MRRLDVGAAARRDIERILIESEERHGVQAAARYRLLIEAAFGDLARRPGRRLPSQESGELHLYPLRSAARLLDRTRAVRAPPHLIAYRFDDVRVEIVRLLHESMDLPRRLRPAITPEGLARPRDDDPEAGGG